MRWSTPTHKRWIKARRHRERSCQRRRQSGFSLGSATAFAWPVARRRVRGGPPQPAQAAIEPLAKVLGLSDWYRTCSRRSSPQSSKVWYRYGRPPGRVSMNDRTQSWQGTRPGSSNASSWPGQAKGRPRLIAENLSFSCSPRPRLGAWGDRPVMADSVSTRSRLGPDFRRAISPGQCRLSALSANWRCRPGAVVGEGRLSGIPLGPADGSGGPAVATLPSKRF
jgi:hypothetical protein